MDATIRYRGSGVITHKICNCGILVFCRLVRSVGFESNSPISCSLIFGKSMVMMFEQLILIRIVPALCLSEISPHVKAHSSVADVL